MKLFQDFRPPAVPFALTGLMLLTLVASSGGAVTGQAAPAATPSSTRSPVKNVAVITPASRTNHGWDQQAADNMTQVGEDLGIDVQIAENQGYEDITPVLRDLADQKVGLIVCHASGYQTTCPPFAQETQTRVAVIENPTAVSPGLISDIETQAQEVAYLAGVLAGKMTRTGTLGIVVSDEPPTWNYMSVGFAEGLHSVRPDAKLLYNVIGAAAYDDAAGAKKATEAELAAGADIIFGMGDGASFGMLQAIDEHNAKANGKRAWFIDVIGDKRDIDTNNSLLTSVLFDYTATYKQMIKDIEEGTFGKVYTLDVENGGVRLLDLPPAVPAEARQAVDQAKADIVAGKTKVSAVSDAAKVRARLKELFPR